MINEEDVDRFLMHYGVKGMKWGQRRAANKAAKKAIKKQSRSEIAADRDKFLQNRMKNVLAEAMKDEKSLIQTRLPADTASTLMSGREFAQRVMSGGLVDAQRTRVYATRNKSGQYKLNDDYEQFVPTYKKQRQKFVEEYAKKNSK